MKVRKIKIVSYRGVREAEIPVGDGGVIAKGRCERGKTSFLDAFRAALVAQGVAPEDIHRGADKAEIIVEADTQTSALRIRRGITRNGSSLTVTNADGFKMDAPQTRLREMPGGGGFDPLDFFLAEEKRRRQIILDATPATVTVDDVRRWIPEEAEPDAIVSLDGHGFEVLSRLRRYYYELRAGANKSAKAAAEDAARAEQAAAAVAGDRNDDLLAREAGIADDLRQARGEVQDVEARERAAARARETSGQARTRIEGLRRQADEWTTAAADARPGVALVDAADRELHAAAARVSQLRHELEEAEKEEASAKRKVDEMNKGLATAERHQKAADEAKRHADELEATLTNAAPEVPEAEAAGARAALETAEAAAGALRRAQEEQGVRAKAEDRRAVAAEAEARAAILDAIVKTLTDVAPRELAARGNAIPGFDVETMSLDGVPLDSLSGGQKLEFAVRLAKRASPEARILIVDGLERLDPERMAKFVELATDQDWQLIASRVEAGGIEFEAIER